ncbi:MAG: F0F1 ATP synthase subunit B [Candidatus Pristimantibacillus lignocellulolyticus]|uniref:ATP synthase subunit b n=1 Tax=Candidatus Pristimantibacillus lignocellulolyticus TaxID=2994561 RepID=A0A9J6ZIN2_9BACL|nr:MAG: F0F1 ATP synthase subunit B [Candidatus Pristimantibacillus lignocellulolyticus]
MAFYPTSTVFTILAFIALLLLLNKYAFGPLFAVMEKRRQLIQEQMNTAASTRQEAEASMAKQKAALEEARKEAYAIIEQARATSSMQADEIVESAKNESARLKVEALKDIESEKNKAISALRAEVGGISVQIASKIIEKQVDEKSQEALVDKYLKEVGHK